MKIPYVLIVCTGNICRSPMASALLRAHAAAAGDTLRVESAGTWGMDGQQASPLARQLMAERGLPMEDHIARTVSAEVLDEADLVVVMTRGHRDALLAEFPNVRSKLHLMSELGGITYDIADPYGKPREAYELCAADLDRLIQRGYPQVREWLALTPAGVRP